MDPNYYNIQGRILQDAPPYVPSPSYSAPPSQPDTRPHLRPALTDTFSYADNHYAQPVVRPDATIRSDLPPGYSNGGANQGESASSNVIPIHSGGINGSHGSLSRRTLPVPPKELSSSRSVSGGRRPLPAAPGTPNISTLSEMNFGPLLPTGDSGNHRENSVSRRPLPANPSTIPTSPRTPNSSSPAIQRQENSPASMPPLNTYPSTYPPSNPYQQYPQYPISPQGMPMLPPPLTSTNSGFMFPPNSLPPSMSPFGSVPGMGPFPPGFLPPFMPPAFPGMPPQYPMAMPPMMYSQIPAPTESQQPQPIQPQTLDTGPPVYPDNGGQATPRPSDRKGYFAKEENYSELLYEKEQPALETKRDSSGSGTFDIGSAMVTPPAPTNGENRETVRGGANSKSIGQRYLAGLSVEDIDLSSVSSRDDPEFISSQAPLMQNGLQSSYDEMPMNRSPYPESRNRQDVGYRESVISLPQSVRTFGEGPSNGNHRGSLAPSWMEQGQEGRPPPARWVQNKLFLHQSHNTGFSPTSLAEGGEEGGYFEEEYEDDYEEEAEEQNEMNFFSPSLLSHVSVQLRDRVERDSHIKGGIPWPQSFTGRDIITTIQSFMPEYTRTATTDRRFALSVAHSLQKQLLFVEVDWDDKLLGDSVGDVYQFMNEIEGLIGSTYEFPTGVETMATKCYSPSCQGTSGCYSPMCPYKTSPETFLSSETRVTAVSEETELTPAESRQQRWSRQVDQVLIDQMSEAEKRRQNIIYQAIQAEEQYEADLNAVETLFISPLRLANPPVIRSLKDLEDLINVLFGNILELKAANASLLEFFLERQREQGGVISTIGDVYLTAAAEFRNLYPDYIGRLPRAEERLREELANNANFRFFIDKVVRQNENRRMDIKFLITRPATQLNRYPQILEAILSETPDESPDATFLVEAVKAIRNLGLTAQLRVWQSSGNREEIPRSDDALVQRERASHQANMLDKPWHEFVSVEDQAVMSEEEKKVQHTIWELIQGEMTYVADLRVIESVYIYGLRTADEPIVERTRLEVFLDDVFHNYRSLLDVHTNLLEKLHSRQEEQHPRIGPISDLIYDAALKWQDAIIEYGSHYPKAKYAWEQEKRTNPKFAAFLERCRNASGTNRQDIGHFAYRPVPRLLRYTLILKDILKHLKKTEQPEHLDLVTIPDVIELIDQQGKLIEKGVEESEAKVALWQLPDSLSGGKFGSEIIQDLDLKNPMRELIHRGRVLRQPEGTITASWSELNALLFNNFFVLTKVGKSKTSQNLPPRYYVNRKPIPLELLTLGTFTDPPQSRRVGLLRNFRSERHDNGTSANPDSESRTVYPFTFSFMGSGQLGGQYTLWADSDPSRKEWQQKLLHAKALRYADIEANKIFEMNPLALDTFYASSLYGTNPVSRPEDQQAFTGRVTCSVPFRTVDNRELVAIGCAEGVWIGLRADPRSLRKVLHVKSVTQCAVLERFSLFLVLSNKTLLAYPMESLVPSSHSTTPPPRGHQKLSDKHEVQYFACGQLSGRSLVVYLRKKGMDSVFRCLEPVTGREMDENRNRRAFTNLLNAKNDWFRVYKDFFVPSEASHVHFLRNRLIVVCAKGFEIIDLTELNPGSIPVFDSGRLKNDMSLAALKSRCDAGARPLGLFRSTESEFLLVYDSFGFFVDRHGYPNRDMRAIEWEGRPETVGFHPPYIVLFSAPFMEIRHISDGRLLQIYCAKDLRCSWDGTSANPEHGVPVPGVAGYTEDMISPEARLHIVQRSENVRGQRRNAIIQDVYELCPTLLLNNPLRDLSSRDSTYFQPAPEVRYSNGGPSNQYGYTPWA